MLESIQAQRAAFYSAAFDCIMYTIRVQNVKIFLECILFIGNFKLLDIIKLVLSSEGCQRSIHRNIHCVGFKRLEVMGMCW